MPDLVVQRIELKHAKAEDVQNVVEGVYWDIVSSNTQARSHGRLTVAAEPVTNSIIVRGPKEIIEEIATLTKTLDEDAERKAKSSEGWRKAEAADIKIFTLKHADATVMMQLLQQLVAGGDLLGLHGLRFSVDVRTNSVIAIGPAEAMRVVEAVLQNLDQAQKESGIDNTHTKTTVFDVSHLPRDGVVNTLTMMLSGTDVQWHDGIPGKTLLAKGNPEGLKLMREALDTVARSIEPRSDQPPSPAFRIRLVWLVHPDLAPDDASAEIPENLKSVVQEIKKTLGVDDLRVAAQMLVNAGEATANQSRMIQSTGTVDLGVAGNAERLAFKAQVFGSDRPAIDIQVDARNHQGEQLANLNTMIVAKPGHAVVLGAAPIKSRDSIFVLEFLPAE